MARNAAHDSVSLLQKQNGRIKSSMVTAVKELTAEEIVLSDALKTPAMQSPGRPGMPPNSLSIVYGINCKT